MSKVHEDNAGYVGVSYEETQDPFYSYNKLALPLSQSDKTAARDEVTLTVTVVNSKFVIDGVSQAALSLTEGVVYKFDQSAGTNAGHPLRLSVTSDGTHSRGTEYYRGVRYVGTPGSSGAYTELTVPFAGIDLHYYCKVHPNMGSSAATPASSTMFTRALPVLNTGNAFGATAQYTVTNGSFNAGSGIGKIFDGSITTEANHAGGASDTFTLTFSPKVQISTSLEVYLVSGSSKFSVNGGSQITVNSGSWTSLSFTGDLTTLAVQGNSTGNYAPRLAAIRVDGEVLGCGAKDPYAANLVLALPLNGANNDTTITDSSGVIRGAGGGKAITLFAGSSTGGGVLSTAQSKYYGSSFYAVRGGVNSNQSDYITRTGDADLAFGEGDFTVEFWFYPTSLVSNYVIFDNRHPTTGWPNSSNGFALIGNSSGTIHVYTGGNNLISADYAIQNQANQWHHIAVSRQDSFTSLYINGVRKGDIQEDLNDYNEGRFTLGSSSPNGEGVTGYFNDLRIYKGVAKYKPEQSGDTGFQAVRYSGLGTAINRVGANVFSNYSAVSGGTVADAEKAFNGSGANWANLTASSTSTAASVDFHFTYPIHGVTKIEAAFDSPSGSGDTRGRYNGANSGATRTGTGSGYSDIYSGSAITVTSVGFAINQNGTTGTNNDIVSRFRVTDSSGTYILVNGQGQYIPFQPDLVWIKNDGSYTGHHVLYDSVRGTSKHIRTSDGTAQYTESANRSLSKFEVDGFTVDTTGGEHQGPGNINSADQVYVAYCWKAGGTATSVSAGSLTASSYNTGQTWSSSLAASQGFKSNLPATQAFDGDPTTRAGNDQSSGGGTLTLTVNINVSSQIRVLTGIQNVVTINGTSIGSAVADPAYVVSNGAKTVTEIVITAPNSNGYRADLFAIEVDGETLLDQSASAPTVPTHASSLSAAPDTGFSIIKWTAASSPSVSRIPHGLSTAPKLIFVKGLNGSVGITAGHEDATWKKRLKLNDTISATTGTGFFNDSPPASKYFTLGSNNVSNDFIAYCFSDVENYQKISSYTGGGNTPVTVTTGFRPQWLLIKADIAGEDWVIMDDARSKAMPATDAFFANTLGVQSNSAYNVYFLDDGFRVHNNNPRFNTQGSTYFYMAIGGSKTTDPKDSVYEFVDQLDKTDLSGNSNHGSNAGVTWQTSVQKFYGGASDFSGNGKVTVSGSDFAFGTGDYTIEMWVYHTVVDTQASYFGDTYGNSAGVYFYRSSSNRLGVSVQGQIVDSDRTVPSNQWVHVAAVRKSGRIFLYMNGTGAGNAAHAHDLTVTDYAVGETPGGNSGSMDGYIQDVRVYKGIAKYTSSFSPPERSVQGTARRYPSGIHVVS